MLQKDFVDSVSRAFLAAVSMLSLATRASVLLSLPTKHQFLFAQKVRDLAEVQKGGISTM